MASARFRLGAVVAGLSLALAGASASQSGPLRIWKIGSPHTGVTPDASIPPAVAQAFRARRLVPEVQALPARDLFLSLRKAVESGSPPDVLVIDNYGLISGITTRLGEFPGIGQDDTIRRQLLRVRGAFDGLLGPAGGWVYLLSGSRKYGAARAAALRAPECGGRREVQPTREFDSIIRAAAAGYMRGDAAVLDRLADPERMAAFHPAPEPAEARAVRICSVSGNMRLTVVSTEVAFESGESIGHSPVLLVFRKPASQWQLLVASLDPVSNREFVRDFSALPGFIERAKPGPAAVPVVLREPANGEYPAPAQGSRFGDFVWDTPPSDDVGADIAEFARHNDARLFVVQRQSGGASRVSSGRLVYAQSGWKWRIWSLTRDGVLSFSEVRTFVH